MEYNEFLELVNENKRILNELYNKDDSEILTRGCEICAFKNPSKAQKIAVLRRVVDLKADPLLIELKKLNLDEKEILHIRDEMFKFTCEIHENLHQKLINQARERKLLSDFYLNLIEGVHKIGLIFNQIQPKWQRVVVDENSKFFEQMPNFMSFIEKNKLFQLTPRGDICDRSYGVVNFQAHSASFVPYAVQFKDDFEILRAEFDALIATLSKNSLEFDSERNAYINYFKKLKNALLCDNNELIIAKWREAEMAWMEIKGEFQIGHPLEYYEDKFTHAVALEWDIRLSTKTSFDTQNFKNAAQETFDEIYEKIDANNDIMHSMVRSNIDKTQLFISTPMIYYGADMDGLFSAQVVPNDEFVSANSGKKIFAFVDFVYESAKAKPFMRLSQEIFDADFLNFGREILFLHKHTWRKVYEITTIGHEFGHLFFIDDDTEALMNRSGVFKYIEEYKATTGGLMNFFAHEKDELKLPVLHSEISRSIGLIAWQEVDEVRAYYCEGLIHLTLLFESGVLKFDGENLQIKFDLQSYENFKSATMKNYYDLAKFYVRKTDASAFLNGFCESQDGKIYMPLHKECAEFVKFYHAKYKAIGNETAQNSEREIWLKRTNELEKKQI